MKIIGYGICGPGEANRYMRETLDCFKKLCDEVVILCNNTTQAEHDLIDEYGFDRVLDRREWGKFQWRIKQDFVEREIKQRADMGDMIVCLDMDEVLDEHLTKGWLMTAPLDAYHVFIVDLWNDPEHYKPESCFWNVRLWKWNGETKFKAKPVHCGLAPEWAYHYHRFAPFILKHYGLMDPEDRQKKIARYEKYDPKAQHLDRKFYLMLNDMRAKPFDQEAIHDTISKEVETYQQTKPRTNPMSQKPKERFAWVKNPHGVVLDIPERHLKDTLARKGFEMVGWADDTQKEMDDLFGDENVGDEEIVEDENTIDASGGSYQRPMAHEKRELDALNSEIPPADEDQDLLDEEDASLLTEDEPNIGTVALDAEDDEDAEDDLGDDTEVVVKPAVKPKAKSKAKKPAAKKSKGKGKK